MKKLNKKKYLETIVINEINLAGPGAFMLILGLHVQLAVVEADLGGVVRIGPLYLIKKKCKRL